ncbi:AbrB/MazE/SpoVT family DNA-binding domain-containing protein [Candidatus Woesearchaeota archaeon]|nr:AbrB/MazE/SpoVT family DNA-binding domain-containing protein [Candidatus Woesearchaeota archaeon]
MRLLSQKSREYKGKDYHKFWIVIPNKLIEKLGWKQGDELEAEEKNDKLVIEKD